MKILHTSDLHGNFKAVTNFEGDFDVWIDTGDFFPNKTRGDRAEEVRYQNRWLHNKSVAKRIVDFLDGRPAVTIGGNHDYISLAEALVNHGGDAYEVSPGGVEVAGVRYAGFRQVPYMMGEWNGEVHGDEFAPIVGEVFAFNPDIILTHAPPAGILDDCPAHGGGVGALMTALCYQPHSIVAHFFGHIHEFGGQSVSEMGVTFANGAGKAVVHTVST